jgi:hypothetical protein
MLEQINADLKEYFDKWETLKAARNNNEFFDALKPVAVGWKAEDLDDYTRICQALHDQCDSIVEVWMNERWIAKLHLKDEAAEQGITIIKVMQRRPSSTDLVGLDHVDFYTQADDNGESVLQAESDLKWSNESNDVLEDYSWLSIWFDGTEAKLKNSTVLNNIIQELDILNKRIIGGV